jgi:hypothetical protein
VKAEGLGGAEGGAKEGPAVGGGADDDEEAGGKEVGAEERGCYGEERGDGCRTAVYECVSRERQMRGNDSHEW